MNNQILIIINTISKDDDEKSDSNISYSYIDLVRTPNMRIKTIVCCFCWFVYFLSFGYTFYDKFLKFLVKYTPKRVNTVYYNL